MNPIPPVSAVAAPGAPPDKLKTVARQFEAIFLQELFKGLEKQPGEEDLFGDSQASRTFDQMHHQALSEQAAGGIGIADMLYRDLLAKQGASSPPKIPPIEPPTSHFELRTPHSDE